MHVFLISEIINSMNDFDRGVGISNMLFFASFDCIKVKEIINTFAGGNVKALTFTSHQ